MLWGVGLLFKEDVCNFKQVQFNNPGSFEVLTAIGTVQGLSRKIALVACYVPPNYTTSRVTECLQYIEEGVIEMKKHLKDPYLVVTGDFNQWQLEE